MPRRHFADDLLDRYRAVLQAVAHAPLLAGFCYTQFADTFQEVNGLLYADRTPKVPLVEIRAATLAGDDRRKERD